MQKSKQELIRTDKFVSSQIPALSRTEVKRLLRAGKITVDGKVVRAPETKINPETDCVCVDGERVIYRKNIYIMLNKPQGYVCSTREGNSPTVLELVPDELRRSGLFPAGRLDKDTEGFVLITDDGALAHNMLSPSRHVAKTYFVRLAKPYSEDYPKALADGLTIDGGEKCLPAFCEADESDPNACRIILHEGKYHQVKRMFAALGNEVVYLKREKIGNLPLDENLPLGACLEIMHKDVEKLLCHDVP